MSKNMVTFCQVTKKVSVYLLLLTSFVVVGCKKENSLESKGSILDIVFPSSKKENKKSEVTKPESFENIKRDPVFINQTANKATTEKNDQQTVKSRFPQSVSKNVKRTRNTSKVNNTNGLKSNVSSAVINNSISTQTNMKKSKVAGLSMILDLGLSSNLKTDNNSEADRSSSVGLTLSKGISRHASMSVLVGVEQSFVDEKKTSVNNTVIQINRNAIPLTNSLKFKSGISATLPTNQDDREKATLMGGTGASFGLEQKTALFKMPTTINYGVGALKNYHEYSRNSELGANLSHRVRYSTSAIIETTKNTSLTIAGYYQTGWTYDNALRTTFNIRETLGYMINKNTEISISHVNSANALGSNGVDSNVSLYDENSSYVELGLSATY